jgi:exopolyphosphatase/guanosine-5'-triphosphate,3'-diphosphate pyrophosphatase
MIRIILPIATSAVREASNQHEFLRSVQKETGFRFKVLTEEEEALYSYIGASRAIWLPEALFFDLGGGSLEMVSTKDYKVKKIISLPLGALRLSERFVSKTNGVLSKKDALSLKSEIYDSLPSSSYLKISNDGIPLVGIGGSVRAIARFHQKITKYPLPKIHNYVMDSFSLQSIRKCLCKLGYNKIANIDAIGKKRAHSITAASFVIDTLMQKLGIEKLIVSTHGLREGYLSKYLRNPLNINSHRLDIKNICNYNENQRNSWNLQNKTSDCIHLLMNFNIITPDEYQIFVCAKRMLKESYFAHAHTNVLFELIMNGTYPMLSQEGQLMLALSLISRRNPKSAEKLYSTYSTLLVHYTKKSMQRVALCTDLSEIFEMYKARVQLIPSEPPKFILKIIPGKYHFPKLTILNKIKALEKATDIVLGYLISSKNDDNNRKKLVLSP